MKNRKEFTFSESELYNFLNTKNANPIKIHYRLKSGDFPTSLTMAKIESDKDYTLLLNLRHFDYNELSKVSMRNNNLDVIAVYFKKLNALVFDSSYEMGDLSERCNDIKVYDSHEVYRDIKNQLEKEFQSRIPSLKERYKFEVDLIQKKADQCKQVIYKEAILGENIQESELIYEYHYEHRVKNLQLVHDYLLDGSSFIDSFVTNYLKELDNSIRAKEIACFHLAKDQMMEELKDDPTVLKAKKIRKLLQSELGNAKKVWVVDKNGDSFQVEGYLDISYDLVQLGKYYNEKHDINDIVAIKYSRKQFDVTI